MPIYLRIILKENMYLRFHKDFPLIHLRFIDDIIFIRTGNKEQLIRNLYKSNTKRDSVKFEQKIKKKNFLDAELYTKNNKFYTKIYRKQTDQQSFVHIASEHPKSLKESLPYSQA